VELGLFSVLGEHPRPAADVAKDLGADARAVDRLLASLTVLGLARVENNGFCATQIARRFLDSASPEFLGGLGHLAQLWTNWSGLTAAVRTGRPAGEALEKKDSRHFEAFIRAMHYRAKGPAAALAEALDLRGARNMLDVGGGSGAFSIALVEKNPNLRAVVLDLPQVAPLAASYVRQAGLSERVSTRAGDFRKGALGEGFDLILLSAIAHMSSSAQNRELLARCRMALNPGGMVAIKDFIMDEDRLSPAFGAFFALNMLVNTQSGDTYTEAEITGWLIKEGFREPRRIELPGPASAIVAMRPHEQEKT
jgi:predicted O-methyltransferase YrrM